jgi:hypothetical protein
MQTATTIAALKGITGASNETGILLGAATAGDGGGGTFYYDSASMEANNDGTIVQPTAVTGAGRWKRIYSSDVNVKWFASKVVSGNWSPAFQAAIGVSGDVYIPHGGYRIDTPLTNTGSVSLTGESLSGVSIETENDINIINFTSPGFFTIRNISFGARLGQTTGAAINIEHAGEQRRLGIIENIRIARNAGTDVFKYGIKVKNPRELILRDILIEGNGTSTMIAIDLSSDQPTMAPTLENIKVYDANIGLNVRSLTATLGLAIEGMKISGSDFVGVDIGIKVDNLVAAPGLNVSYCHVSASSTCISLKNINQVFITDTLMYMNGAGGCLGVSLDFVQEASVSNNKLFFIGTGFAYGITCNSGLTRNVKVVNNYTKLRANGNETAIWFGPNASHNQALYNVLEGANTGFDVLDQGSGDILVGNVRYNA